MKRLAAVLALSVSALALAAQASAAPKPASMATQLIRYEFKGQWGPAWDLLHPSQQRIVPRAKFAACQKALAALAGYRLVDIRTVDSSNETLHIAGIPQHTAVAVTLHLLVRTGLGNENGLNEVTHTVWTGTRWAWFFGAADVAAYRAGHCPS